MKKELAKINGDWRWIVIGDSGTGIDVWPRDLYWWERIIYWKWPDKSIKLNP